MKTLKVRRLYKGMVSVRDYIIDECLLQNILLKIVHNGKYMILTPEQLVAKRSQMTRRIFKSKTGGANYQLFDYEWQPQN